MARGKGGRSSSGNQRSDVKNPNNATHRAAANNRSNQLNPNNPAGSRQGNSPGPKGK